MKMRLRLAGETDVFVELDLVSIEHLQPTGREKMVGIATSGGHNLRIDLSDTDSLAALEAWWQARTGRTMRRPSP
jgi:hypothetical protein